MTHPVSTDAPVIDTSKRDFMKKTATLSAAAALMSLVPPGIRGAAWVSIVKDVLMIAAVAVANAVTCDGVWGQTLLIGGGERCRLLYGQIVSQILNAVGVGMLPAQAPFSTSLVR